jgi:hypothetical protein
VRRASSSLFVWPSLSAQADLLHLHCGFPNSEEFWLTSTARLPDRRRECDDVGFRLDITSAEHRMWFDRAGVEVAARCRRAGGELCNSDWRVH